MLVYTMTDEEKQEQAIEDINEVNRYIKYNLYKKLHKGVKKFDIFPRIFKASYVTKNNNKYFLMFRADSRNTFDKGYWVHAYTIMDSNEGKYAMIAVTQSGMFESFQIYAPHLFKRYTERHGLKLYEEERIHRFMEDSINLKYGGVKTKNGKAFGVVNGGAIFGDVKGFTIIFKTFVDDSLLRSEQIEYGEEVIESFKERMDLFREVFG